MGATGTRGRCCPDCHRTWPGADARFCGCCGALLTGTATTVRVRPARVARLVTRLAGGLFLGLLVLAASSSQPTAISSDTTVDLPAEASGTTNALSDDELAQLRDRSDPNRLRCVPRGCEAWRFDRERAPMASGVVALGDGERLLALLGTPPGTPGPGAAAEERDGGHRLIAIDATTGVEDWSRPASAYRSISGAYRWVRLREGPEGGALVITGTTVTALDADGEQLWTAVPDAMGGPVREVWDAVTTEHAVLLSGTILDRSSASHHLTAIDPAAGSIRWSADVGQVVTIENGIVVVIDPDGTLHALDDASGASRWSRPGMVTHARVAGPWLAVQEGATLHLVEPETGADVATTNGWLTSSLVAANEYWVGTVREPGQEPDAAAWADEAARMHVVAFDAAGAVVWSEPVGSVGPWWDCCPVRVDRERDVVTVTDPVRDLHHDIATGRLVDVDVVVRASERAPRHRGLADAHVQHPAPGVEVVMSDDGRRLDVATPEGWVTVRSPTGLRLESLDPLVVSDGRELLGLAVGGDAAPRRQPGAG